MRGRICREGVLKSFWTRAAETEHIGELVLRQSDGLTNFTDIFHA